MKNLLPMKGFLPPLIEGRNYMVTREHENKVIIAYHKRYCPYCDVECVGLWPDSIVEASCFSCGRNMLKIIEATYWPPHKGREKTCLVG